MNHMNSITLHNLDTQLYQSIRQKATEDGLSLNATIKQLLSQALGISKTKKQADFSQFCGQWTEQELQEFQQHIKPLETVHPGDWEV